MVVGISLGGLGCQVVGLFGLWECLGCGSVWVVGVFGLWGCSGCGVVRVVGVLSMIYGIYDSVCLLLVSFCQSIPPEFLRTFFPSFGD